MVLGNLSVPGQLTILDNYCRQEPIVLAVDAGG